MESQSSMTKFFILSALRRKDMHGYELICEIENIIGKKPSASQVYPVLKKLQSSGFLAVKSREKSGKKIKVYSITSQGNELFKNISARFDAIIEAALRDKIKVCAHCKCEILKGSVRKVVRGKSLYFCCNSCASSY